LGKSWAKVEAGHDVISDKNMPTWRPSPEIDPAAVGQGDRDEADA
jgi:hypothetical protein